MNNNEKVTINNKQLTAIVVCLTWPTIINYGSSFLARKVGRDLWISGIIGILTTMLFIYIPIYIGRNFTGKTIVEYSQDLIGKFLGKILGFMLTLFFFISAAICISMYIHHLTDFLLSETPFIVVTIMHLIVICYLTWHGPKVIGRISTFALLFAYTFFVLVFLASISEYKLDRIMPLFDSGVAAVSKASLTVDTFTGIIPISISMLLPLVENKAKVFRSSAIGLAIGGSFFVFYFISELMVMGPYLVASMRIASMDFVRSIQITKYLHRFESFMVSLWYWSILVQAGVMSYCALKAFKQTMGIKSKSPYFVLIFGLLMGVLTYYIGYNRVFFLNFREFAWQYISISFQFILPVFLLIVVLLKKLFRRR